MAAADAAETTPATAAARREAAKRAQIVEAARRLVLAQGYSRVSMAEIARAAGVSSATLYRHYDGKPAVLADVVEAAAQAIATRLNAVPLPADDLDAAIRGFARTYARLLLEPDVVRLLRVIIAEADAIQPVARRFVAVMKGPATDRLRDHLIARDPDRRTDPAGAEARAMRAMTLLLGWLERGLLIGQLLDADLRHDPAHADEVAGHAADALLAQIARR